MFRRGTWLGQVPFAHGTMRRRLSESEGTPPYYGDWGIYENGAVGARGQEGPFNTREEAFQAAVKAAKKAGAEALPDDGYARVIDSQGRVVGPTT
jgi:hypothetical protein